MQELANVIENNNLKPQTLPVANTNEGQVRFIGHDWFPKKSLFASNSTKNHSQNRIPLSKSVGGMRAWIYTF